MKSKKFCVQIALISSLMSLIAMSSFAGPLCSFPPQSSIAPIEFSSPVSSDYFVKVTVTADRPDGYGATISVDIYSSKTKMLVARADVFDADYSFNYVNLEGGILRFSANNVDQSSGAPRCYTSSDSLDLTGLIQSYVNPGQFPNGGDA